MARRWRCNRRSQAALARNKIAVQLPWRFRVRAGSGYVQMVQSSGANSTAYMLAEADQAGAAYVVGAPCSRATRAWAVPTGALGYPASDQSSGGTQQFQNGAALAGSPVRGW